MQDLFCIVFSIGSVAVTWELALCQSFRHFVDEAIQRHLPALTQPADRPLSCCIGVKGKYPSEGLHKLLP